MTSTTPDDLVPLTGVELPVELDPDSLAALFGSLTGLTDEGATGACEDAFLAALDRTPDSLDMRPGGWKVDVAATAVRTSLATAIMTGVLWSTGFDQIPTYVLPAILPTLVAAERVQLNRKEKYLLAQLQQGLGAAAGVPMRADRLYDKLPAQTRAQLSPLDFRDFLDAFVAAGAADAGPGDEVRLRAADEPAWIRIRFE